jgi:hypothetical protein
MRIRAAATAHTRGTSASVRETKDGATASATVSAEIRDQQMDVQTVKDGAGRSASAS